MDHHPLSLLQFDLSTRSGRSRTLRMQPVSETLDILSAITTPVAVVAIAGPSRTGKSFFLNQMLPPQMATAGIHPGGGFTVGHNSEAQTQEVQLHILPACALQSSGMQDATLTVLYLDTPGLFSADRPNVFDSQLLALLNVLSSVLLYNTRGTVHRGDIDQLAVAMETAFLLSFFSPKPGSAERERLQLDRPHLVWLFQDFQFNNTQRTGVDYLRRQLSDADQGLEASAASSYTDRFNRFFASLEGQTFPYPAEHTQDLSKLSELQWEQLSPEFRQGVQDVRAMIAKRVYAKQVMGGVMTGELLVDVLRVWIELMAVEVGDLREQGTDVLFREVVKREVGRARQQYAQLMQQLTLPVTEAALQAKSADAMAAIVKGKDGITAYMAEVRSVVNELYSKLQAENMASLQQHGGQKLQALSEGAVSKAKATLREIEGDGSRPYADSRLEEAEHALQAEWLQALQALDEATRSISAQYEAQWKKEWEQLKVDSQRRNQHLSVQSCLQRAAVVSDYYRSRHFWSDWQTRADFTTQLSQLAAGSGSLPPYMMAKADRGESQVVCIGPGQTDSGVKEAYADVSLAFERVRWTQLSLLFVLQLALCLLAAYASQKVAVYWSALGGGSVRAKTVDAAEGHNCWLFLAAAAASLWIARSGSRRCVERLAAVDRGSAAADSRRGRPEAAHQDQ